MVSMKTKNFLKLVPSFVMRHVCLCHQLSSGWRAGMWLVSVLMHSTRGLRSLLDP